MKVPPLQWADDPDGSRALEIQRLAEIQLEDVVTLAISGDGRAATLGAAMSAIAAGMLAAATAVATLAGADMRPVYALFAGALAFIVAAGFAVLAAAPTDFYLRGYDPARLAGHAGETKDIVRWTTEDMAARLAHNRSILVRSGRRLNTAYWISLAGIVVPIVGLILAERYT